MTDAEVHDTSLDLLAGLAASIKTRATTSLTRAGKAKVEGDEVAEAQWTAAALAYAEVYHELMTILR